MLGNHEKEMDIQTEDLRKQLLAEKNVTWRAFRWIGYLIFLPCIVIAILSVIFDKEEGGIIMYICIMVPCFIILASMLGHFAYKSRVKYILKDYEIVRANILKCTDISLCSIVYVEYCVNGQTVKSSVEFTVGRPRPYGKKVLLVVSKRKPKVNVAAPLKLYYKEIKGKELRIDPKAKARNSSIAPFLSPPSGSPVYHGFPLIEETRTESWCLGAITEFEDANGCEAGDAFIEAPNGDRAGIVWEAGEGEIERICAPGKKRWGVYQVWFPKPVRNAQDLKENFEFILPAMKKIYSEVKVRSKKSEFAQWLIGLAACFCSLHFAISIVVWILFGLWVPLFVWKGEYRYIDWPMFLHAIPTVILFCGSILTIIFVRKRKIVRASQTLGFVLIMSVLCFFFETTNDFYQFFSLLTHRGNQYSLFGMGYQYMYWNWIWYPEKFWFSEMDSEKNYKYGYIDKSGQVIVEPQFDYTYHFSEGLARIKLDDKYGYINKHGTVVIKPNFDDARNFHEGLAAVEISNKWGFVNKKGVMVIEPQFDFPNNFSDGLIPVMIEGKIGYMDMMGQLIVNPQFESASSFSEGLASVEADGKVGYIDTTGQVVIKIQFDSALRFSEGLAAVEIDNKWGYVDKNGQVVIVPQFQGADRFSEGLAVVEVANKKGFIDKTGRIVIEPQFDSARGFSDGLAQVENLDYKWGYRRKDERAFLDRTGKPVVKPYYDTMIHFSDGLAVVKVGEKYGYIDKTGMIVIESQFDTAGPFSEGLARIGVEIAKEGKNE